MLVALVAISRLVHALGTQRVGILTLVWMLIGYLSLLDLGVGCAFTNLVAQKSGAGEEKSLPPLILTANILMRMPETELRNLTCGQAPEVAVARGH